MKGSSSTSQVSKAHRGKPYLVTQDTRPSDFADSAIAVEDLLASLRDATVPTRVFVLDSCHSGIHRDAGRQRGTGVDAFERTLTQLFLQDEGSVVFSSATLDEVARETILNGEGHGVFTHAFAESHPEQRRSADSGQLACVETLYTRARGLTLELSRSTQHPRLLYAAGDPIPLFPDIPDTAELVQRASGDFTVDEVRVRELVNMFRVAQKAIAYAEMQTLEYNIVGVSNMRDALSHLVLAMDSAGDESTANAELMNAEEHLRRACIESMQTAVEAAVLDYQQRLQPAPPGGVHSGCGRKTPSVLRVRCSIGLSRCTTRREA